MQFSLFLIIFVEAPKITLYISIVITYLENNDCYLCSRPIRLENFSEHYRIMSADSDFRFSEEFEELKHVGREQPCTAADLPCNRPKNRFTNILPYDHSRFKLQPVDDEEGSDYINANYVPVSIFTNNLLIYFLSFTKPSLPLIFFQ